MRNSLRFPLIVTFLLFVLANFAVGQLETGVVSGTVTDPSGAVVARAKVDALSADTGKARQVVTNAQGIYVLPSLPAGQYTIAFSAEGFETVRYESVLLLVGQTVTLDSRLPLKSQATSVEVKAAASLLDRNSAEIASVVGSTSIENLPVNGRNWANLLVLAPGAIDDGGGNQRTIRFAGRARDDNNYMFDGVDATGIQEQAQKSTHSPPGFGGRDPGIPRKLGTLRGGIRRASRRPGGYRHQIRHEPVPRRSVRVHPQQCARFKVISRSRYGSRG